MLTQFSKTKYVRSLGLICFFLITAACSENSEPVQSKVDKDVSTQKETLPTTNDVKNEDSSASNNGLASKNINYDLLQKNIIYGRATLADVYNSLTQRDVGTLTNTIHTLYNMRWHRGVYNVIHDLWNNEKEKHPDFAWDLIQKTPVRIALASTINRIVIINTDEYIEYIRSHKEDEHEFHRAQVVIALGFNGEIKDIEYIKSMANGDNHYVAQSAISALAIMGNNQARDAMAQLWKSHKGTERGKLIKNLLAKIYKVEPSLTEPKKNNE